jgi:hypothetical protein
LRKAQYLAILSVFAAPDAFGASFPTLQQADAANPARFGGGLVNNSSYYSSNPSYRPGDPYYSGGNKLPVYITIQPQNEVVSGECDSLLSSVFAAECGLANGCAGMNLQGVKPRIMVRLAQIPGKDYVGACAGLIDIAFDRYMNNKSSPGLTGGSRPLINYTGGSPAAKPTPTIQPINMSSSGLTGGSRPNQFPTAGDSFPTTISDVSFMDRMDNTRAGLAEWKPVYKDGKCVENCAYVIPDIESYDAAQKRWLGEAKQKAELDRFELKEQDWCKWCDRYPADCADELSGKTAYVEIVSQSQNPDSNGAIASGIKSFVGNSNLALCGKCHEKDYPRNKESCLKPDENTINKANDAMKKAESTLKTAKDEWGNNQTDQSLKDKVDQAQSTYDAAVMNARKVAATAKIKDPDCKPNVGFFPGLAGLDAICGKATLPVGSGSGGAPNQGVNGGKARAIYDSVTAIDGGFKSQPTKWAVGSVCMSKNNSQKCDPNMIDEICKKIKLGCK